MERETTMMDPKAHYTGHTGRSYFGRKFSGNMDLGRKYQSRYFQPFCNPEKVLLDFGCGDGTLVRELPALKTYGVEINPTCRDKINAMNRTHDRQIEVFASIDEIKGNSVDVTISNHCLEHVSNPLEILLEIRRVLRNGGELAMVVPFDDWRQKGQKRWREDDMEKHLFTWSPQNLGNLLSAAGLEVKTVRLCSTAWSPKLFWIHRLAGKRMFSTACRLFALVKQRREVFSLSYAYK